VLHPIQMKILLREQANNFDKGCFGQVFFLDGCAIKVFTRPPENTEYDLEKIDVHGQTIRRRHIFNSEVLAYTTALEVEELRTYVSHFRGERIISKVFDIDNNDISDRFLLDCAYAMDHLQGQAIKCGCNTEKSDPIAFLFRKHGINAMNDFSFFLDDSGKVAKIIDFAVQEYD